jgi:hypothetical protein
MPPTDGGARASRPGSTRATPVVLLGVAALLLGARVGFGVYEHARPADRPDLIEWRQPGAGEAEARSRGKLVLYFFTVDGSKPCRAMARELFGDANTAAAINQRFVPIRVLDLKREEGHNSPDVESLEQRYDVKKFPSLVVTIPDRERFEKQSDYPGALATRNFLSQSTAMVVMPTHEEMQHMKQTRDSLAAVKDSAAMNAPDGR